MALVLMGIADMKITLFVRLYLAMLIRMTLRVIAAKFDSDFRGTAIDRTDVQTSAFFRHSPWPAS